MIIKRLLFIVFLLLAISGQYAYASISVIVHPENDFDLEALEIRKIFLQKTKILPNGLEAIPLDLPNENPSSTLFAKLVLHKSKPSLNAYWARMLFSSKGTPPRKMPAQDVLLFVANNKQAIGYVDSQLVDDRVRVILTAP